MKKFLVVLTMLIGLFLTGAVTYAADVNRVTDIETAQTQNMDNPPIIQADKKRFDIFTLTYTLEGNVWIQHKTRSVKADYASYNLAAQEVKAKGHIHFADGDFKVACDELSVNIKQNTAVLAGHVTFDRGTTKVTSDGGSFNWESRKAVFEGNVSITENGRSRNADKITYDLQTEQFN